MLQQWRCITQMLLKGLDTAKQDALTRLASERLQLLDACTVLFANSRQAK